MAKSISGFIKLYNDVVVAVDQYNYSLAKIKVKKDKDGEEIEYFDYISHHSTLNKALVEFRRYLVREKLMSGIMEISEAINAINEIDEQLMLFIKENVPDA